VSGEATKFGFPVSEGIPAWANDLAKILELPCLEVRGLMTLAPYSEEAAAARPYFSRLRRLRDQLASQFGRYDWPELSMGMSVDFECAIEEGATLVRIGEAILGPRPSRNENP
jgi:uncharacterized pyridoxal phosphate-containing UPF0001 family protein